MAAAEAAAGAAIWMNIFSDRFIDLRVYQSGTETCTPGHSFGPARRKHYLFHYILSGSGTFRWEDADGISHEQRLGASDGFMIYPDQICIYTADIETPWTYMWIEFDGLRVPESLQSTYLSRNTPIYRGAPQEERERMEREMFFICSDEPDPQIFHIIAHMYLFLAYLTESAPAAHADQGSGISDHYVRTALDFIEANYAAAISIEDIAAQCGIDRSYFGKIFHQVMGQSPRRFLLQYRMTRATTLLQHTDQPIANIGAAVGYDNPLHFSRAFKNVHGVSPSEWRQQHRKPGRK